MDHPLLFGKLILPALFATRFWTKIWPHAEPLAAHYKPPQAIIRIQCILFFASQNGPKNPPLANPCMNRLLMLYYRGSSLKGEGLVREMET